MADLLEKLTGVRQPGFVVTALFVVVVAVVTVLAARLASWLLRRVIEQQKRTGGTGNAAVLAFFRYIAIAAVYFAGFAVVVSAIPALSAAMNKLLAAGGVLAVVGGIASQEALGSMVSGMMILVFKPFVIGDVVRYIDGDISGVVEEITLHHTTIRTWENKRIIVPNGKMNSAIIENADYGDSRVCVFLKLGVTYESDLALAKQLLCEAIVQHPSHLDVRTPEQVAAGAPEAQVVVLEFAESAVVLRAALWAKDNGTAFGLKCDVLEQVKQAYDRNGIALAYPHLVVMQK